MIAIRMPSPDKLFSGLDPRSLKLVKVRAQNALAAKAKTLANKVAREDYTAKAETLRKAMYVQKANLNDQVATLVVSGPRTPLGKFRISPGAVNPKTQRRLRGTKVQERRSSPLAARPGLFTARMKSGHVGVFMRIPGTQMKTPSESGKGRKRREMLREPSGVSPAEMVKSPKVMAKLRALIHTESELIYKRELAFELSKASATVRL